MTQKMYFGHITEEQSHCATLRLSPSASVSELKAAYKSLALQLHPDKNEDSQDAKEQFIKVKEAYDFLLPKWTALEAKGLRPPRDEPQPIPRGPPIRVVFDDNIVGYRQNRDFLRFRPKMPQQQSQPSSTVNTTRNYKQQPQEQANFENSGPSQPTSSQGEPRREGLKGGLTMASMIAMARAMNLANLPKVQQQLFQPSSTATTNTPGSKVTTSKLPDSSSSSAPSSSSSKPQTNIATSGDQDRKTPTIKPTWITKGDDIVSSSEKESSQQSLSHQLSHQLSQQYPELNEVEEVFRIMSLQPQQQQKEAKKEKVEEKKKESFYHYFNRNK